MKLQLGAAVLMAALTPLTAVTAPSPASAGVNTTPPAVGSCHALTYNEYLAAIEPDPAVACSERHTSVTVMVREFSTPPDWTDFGQIVRRMFVPCLKSLVRVTGGFGSLVQLSPYGLTFYKPTKAQRDAGAAWVRCDAVLHGGPGSLAPVPEDLTLHWPTGLHVRKCRLGKRADFALTVCSRRHKYIAMWTVRMRGDTYPGERVAKRFARRECFERVGDPAGGDPFVYEWVSSRALWRAGLRYAVCLPLKG